MDIESKKTVLDDEASIYKKRKTTYTRQDMKNMSSKERLKYFRDYYLKKLIIAILIIVVACVIIKDIVFDKSECVLYVSCINSTQPDDTDFLIEELNKIIDRNHDEDFSSVINYDLSNAQFNMSFVTLTQAGVIDIAICPADYFEEAAGAGMFADLSQFLPKDTYTALSDKIKMASPTERDIDGNVIKYYDPLPFGIDISGNPYFSGTSEEITLCVLNGAPNKDNILNTVSFFTEN